MFSSSVSTAKCILTNVFAKQFAPMEFLPILMQEDFMILVLLKDEFYAKAWPLSSCHFYTVSVINAKCCNLLIFLFEATGHF